jgi:iron complex outermembrane receptor protein
MRKSFFAAAVLCCICVGAGAQESGRVEKLDSAIVSVSRAGKNTPVTYSTIGKEELRSAAPSKSLPMILSLQPSVVSTNEGGTGLGYSKLTVRGSKGSQINVTLNGITLNDSESQEVFWVNIPALGNILGSVQLQRGLGTSANGAGAFGASINMNTGLMSPKPSSNLELGGGSYNTGTLTFSAGSGLLPGGFYADIAFSAGTTDGYIRNAWADVHSFFGVAGWIRGNNSVKFTVLSGSQHTGITWEGVSASKMAQDRRYNPAGKYKDAEGNTCYYDNESDNYLQTHYQLNYTHQFSLPLIWSTTLNYTKGDGYYEQYKAGKEFAKYGLNGTGKADFITRKEMDNGYAVLNSTLSYTTDRLDLNGGLYLAAFSGDHFGNVIWNSVSGETGHEWYRYNGNKKEATAFARAEYQAAEWLTAYAELQCRLVGLVMGGKDDEFSDMSFRRNWDFLNPHAGLTGNWGAHKAYFSFAEGHREPGKSDLKEQIESANALKAAGKDGEVTLRPEMMFDTEAGYEYAVPGLTVGVNLYSMEYKDMLLETGKLSDSGYAIKENVDRSWRRGVEMSVAWMPSRWMELNGNLTLSTNRIKDFSYYEETYDNPVDWKFVDKPEIRCGTVTMLMSPSCTGMAGVKITPFAGKGFRFGVDGKYVGRQYWDNTQNEDLCIPAWYVFDGHAEYSFPLWKGFVTIGAYCNNILNRDYYADAWVYRALFADGSPEYIEEGLFPQALRNFSFKLRLAF